jgi:hypothetical protein
VAGSHQRVCERDFGQDTATSIGIKVINWFCVLCEMASYIGRSISDKTAKRRVIGNH